MVPLAPQKKLQKRPFLRKIGTFLLVFSALFFGGALLPLATGLSLSIAWFSCALASLLFLFITRTRGTRFLTVNLLFISGMLIVMDEQARSSLGSPAWNQAVGGLVVAVWVAGLLYIVLASLVRLFGKHKMDRYFPPRVVGPTLILAGLAAIPFLIETNVVAPIRDFGASGYKFWLLFAVTVIPSVVIFLFKKTRKISRLVPAGVGLVTGLLTALLLDGIELLWISKDLSQTLLLGPLSQISPNLPVFVFQDLETYFGFWSYVHFDAQALVAIVPLVLIAFGIHLTSESKDPVETGSVAPLGTDRVLVAEGICTMASGLLSGMPVAVNFVDESDEQKHSVWPFLVACFALLILSLFNVFTGIQGIVPTPIVGGTLIGVLLIFVFQGYELAFQKGVGQSWKNRLFPIAILVVGMAGTVFYFIHSLFNLWSSLFSPWGILLAPLSIVVILSFLVNAFLPPQAKVSSKDVSTR